ncbi:pyruvate kinase [[Clostridium] polysaccharolyticum]|uniref:Pyruvate kinase n=1 Tax=[Clostridium] polysaccharolyticum TaxID=29364 RepID=A0A1I0D2Q9_9FIRM|nr:pyruvate kinase [[Clostridium] polysaccharolyticum]SET26191.1 pyruvate kinase [[Clostridium] polysaccharolyticum]
MRKTKIICTLGPATDQPGVLKQVAEAGMDVARFNFSHGSYEEHGKRFDALCKVREEAGRPIAALLDTKGPEIRLRDFANGKEYLEKGQTFTLTTREIAGTKDIVSISYTGLPKDVKIGTRILIDDGLIEMTVEGKTETDIVCKVLNEGPVSNTKGVNVPDTRLSMPYLSEKDREDIIFACKTGYDFVAASFVRSAADVFEVRKVLSENNGDAIRIISKIENKEGVDNIDEIIEASDGIMIARGDMGVEIPGEEVPVIQKMIIKKVYKAGKQVITATQMLDSMMKNPRPTRAEISDVANAIYDGTGAIMLSGETAAGKYPVESVAMMAKIAERTEKDIDYKKRFRIMESKEHATVREAISHATVMTAHDLNAEAIVSVTMSGSTARRVAKYRPASPIIGCSVNEQVLRQLNLAWGVIPIKIEKESDTMALFGHAVNRAKEAGYLKAGDIAVITAGIPLGIEGATNMIKVEKAGE